MKHPLFKKHNLFNSAAPIKRAAWGPVLPFLAILFLILGQLLTLVPIFELDLIPEEELETYPNIIYMLLAPFSAIILLITLWVRFFEGRKTESLGVGIKKGWFKQFGIGYGVGLLMAFVIVFAVWGLGGYELESGAGFQWSDALPLIILLFGFIVQSGAEEFIFRGWLFSRVTERYNLFVGIAVNAAIFILMHLPGVDFANDSAVMITLGILMSLLFSVFLSLLVIKQQSIWGAAAWHAAWNWFFINGFGLATTGIELGLNPMLVDLKPAETAPTWLSGGEEGPEGSILTIIVLFGACLIVSYQINKKKSLQTTQKN